MPDRHVETEAISAATIDLLLDRLSAGAGRLTPNARSILEHLAAGGDGLRRDLNRGPRAAATARLRLVTRRRDNSRIRVALTG